MVKQYDRRRSQDRDENDVKVEVYIDFHVCTVSCTCCTIKRRSTRSTVISVLHFVFCRGERVRALIDEKNMLRCIVLRGITFNRKGVVQYHSRYSSATRLSGRRLQQWSTALVFSRAGMYVRRV